MPYHKNPLIIALFTAFILFFGLAIFFKLIGPIPFFIQNVTTQKENLFSVDGVGEATAIPDTALITLGVSKTSSSIETAKNQVNTIINKITNDLKGLGINIKDIKTTDYSITPQYDYNRSPIPLDAFRGSEETGSQGVGSEPNTTNPDETPDYLSKPVMSPISEGDARVVGYTVNASLQVKLQPIDKANDAIDIATKDGANRLGGIQFVIDDKAQKELEQKAREEAIKNAREKAEGIAKAAGIKLGRIVDVRESASGYPRPMPLYMEAAKSADTSVPTQLNPGENKVSTTVTLSYETY